MSHHQKNKKCALLFLFILISLLAYPQDTCKSTLILKIPVIDYPENFQHNYRYPSMQEALDWSSALYDLTFLGIHEGTAVLVKNRKNSIPGKIAAKSLEYLAGYAFARYASELPIPLGVWGHEAWHGSVLGTAGLSPLNGNSVFHRWDGTVYGLSDEELTALKTNKLPTLLYSYVAGVQYELSSTRTNVINDFFQDRKFYKAPLYLYNAWYVYNYFSFSVSPFTDSVKVIAPQFEDPDPYYRDYAGADLTAWVYDMFSPEQAWDERDAFPVGDGVNRRVAFSELSTEGQDYLLKQKKLALLNFINPAIFLINRIRIGEHFSFLPFIVYTPTHFGNSISLELPFMTGERAQYLALNRYANSVLHSWGIDYSIYNLVPLDKLSFDLSASLWNQPGEQGFYDTELKTGGQAVITVTYMLNTKIALSLDLSFKGKGWVPGNPYLSELASARMGFLVKL